MPPDRAPEGVILRALPPEAVQVGAQPMICQPCGRYVKALDARKATRPLLPYVDVIATLPLDAAVMKRS